VVSLQIAARGLGSFIYASQISLRKTFHQKSISDPPSSTPICHTIDHSQNAARSTRSPGVLATPLMMSQDVEPAINWEPHKAEILSHFVEQNHTLEETMAHMRNAHGLNATCVSLCSGTNSSPPNISGTFQRAPVQETIRRIQESESTRVDCGGRRGSKSCYARS
jgi:hypothetical protein